MMAGMRCIWNGFRVTEAIHYIAVGIEFHEQWRLLRNLCFLVRHVIPINNENVILSVHTYTAHLSVYPVVSQRLWPAGIDYELRATVLRLRARDASQGGQEPRE